MLKGDKVQNRSDHAAACPQVFREFPAAPAPVAVKKSKKKKAVVAEVVEDVVEEVIEDDSSDSESVA